MTTPAAAPAPARGPPAAAGRAPVPLAAFGPRREGGPRRGRAAVYLALHLLPRTALADGVSRASAVWAGVLLLSRGFCFSAGYHRCLAHRSYRTSRVLQLVLAAGGGAALRGGPLWWAGLHRHHHRFADTDVDVHSPATRLWWGHVGWLLS